MHNLSLDEKLDRAEAAPEHSPADRSPDQTPLPVPTRIVQVLEGASWGELTPETINRGLGGRETALLQLSQHFALNGHHVLNFVPISSPYRQTFPSGGSFEMIDVRLAPHYLDATEQDVVIAWEHPTLFSFKRISQNAKVKIIGMQVAHLEMDEQSVHDIDAIVTLSDWARRFLITSSPYLSSVPFFVIPNGVDLSRFTFRSPNQSNNGTNRRQNGRFVYSSSPDRGLIHLLNAWPRILREIPKAELYVAYGVSRWTNQLKWSHFMQGDMALQIERLMKQPGVIDVGLIGQDHLARIQMDCSLLPYPCDTMSPTETGCITVTEALAALCPVVTTDCDCLGEEYGNVAEIAPLPYDEDIFLNTMFTILEDEDRYVHRQVMGREFAEERSWHSTSTTWMNIIAQLLQARAGTATVSTATTGMATARSSA